MSEHLSANSGEPTPLERDSLRRVWRIANEREAEFQEERAWLHVEFSPVAIERRGALARAKIERVACDQTGPGPVEPALGLEPPTARAGRIKRASRLEIALRAKDQVSSASAHALCLTRAWESLPSWPRRSPSDKRRTWARRVVFVCNLMTNPDLPLGGEVLEEVGADWRSRVPRDVWLQWVLASDDASRARYFEKVDAALNEMEPRNGSQAGETPSTSKPMEWKRMTPDEKAAAVLECVPQAGTKGHLYGAVATKHRTTAKAVERWTLRREKDRPDFGRALGNVLAVKGRQMSESGRGRTAVHHKEPARKGARRPPRAT